MRLPELVRHGRPSLWLQFGCLAATLIMLFRWQSQLLLAYLASPWPLRARSSGRSVSDLTQFVNPLIGSIKGGHVFAGASTPFGSVKGAYRDWRDRALHCTEVILVDLQVSSAFKHYQWWPTLRAAKTRSQALSTTARPYTASAKYTMTGREELRCVHGKRC